MFNYAFAHDQLWDPIRSHVWILASWFMPNGEEFEMHVPVIGFSDNSVWLDWSTIRAWGYGNREIAAMRYLSHLVPEHPLWTG